MIAIIDYGMGNLRSVQKALEKVGAEAFITQDQKEIEQANKVVLPGVGATRPAMEKLSKLEIIPSIRNAIDSGKPFLGICLGFQLLFETSNEGGIVEGLGVLPGTVERFTQLKVPHMGWNQLHIKKTDCPLWKNMGDGANVYFCHSYYVKPKGDDVISTTTDYGVEFTSSISKGNLFGVQFHPEKSQKIGLQILENFTSI